MRQVWLAVGLAACADIPDEPLAGDISTELDPNTGAALVTGPGYQLEFGLPGRPDSFAMPSRLKLLNGDDHDVLEGTQEIPCAFEAGIGLALFPGIDITAYPGRLGPNGAAMMSNLVAVPGMQGPGAIQYDVGYTARYQVGAGMQTFAGHSTFTFFATGRIVRHDDFDASMGAPQLTTNPSEPIGCGGVTGDGFFLTSYWAFENLFNGDVVAPDGSDAPTGAQACTFYPGRHTLIGVSFQPPGAGQGVRFEPGGNSAGHVFDFLTDNGSPATSVPQVRYSVTSAIKIATADDITRPDQCADVVAELDDQAIMIDGRLVESNENGIHAEVPPVRHESAFTIRPANAKIPPGLAVLVDLGDATHADVTKDPEGGEDPPALAQRLPNGLVLFVFREALLANETITIEPF